MAGMDCKGLFLRKAEALLYRLGYQVGHPCKVYLVGDVVRDLLLGRENRNLQLLVEGDLPDYVNRLQQSLPGKVRRCDLLGTAAVYLPDGYILKISTLITDYSVLAAGKDLDGEKTLKNELFKRDFTVDTLALGLNSENFCRLYDYFGGVKDLDQGLIRVLYSLSFSDDPMRLLRSLRMEQRYGFSVDGETGRLMREAIASRVLHKVSRESITRELRRIFNTTGTYRVLQRVFELGLWQQVFSRLPYREATLQQLQGLEEVAAGIILAEDRPFRYNTFIIYLCGLFYGLSRHDLQFLAHKLRLKKAEREEIMQILYGPTTDLDASAGDRLKENGLAEKVLAWWNGEKGVIPHNVV